MIERARRGSSSIVDAELGRERVAVDLGRLNLRVGRLGIDVRPLPLAPLALGYIVLSAAVSVWLSPREEVQAALALPSMALLPLLIGGPVFRALPIDTPELDWFGRALIGWLLGALTLTAFAVLLQLGGQAFLLQRYGLVALALGVVGVAAAVRRRPEDEARWPITGVAALGLVAATILAVAPKAITVWYTPFPLVMQNFLDPMFYSQPALRMLEHGYLDLDNLAHAPALLSLIAIHSQLYDTQPLSLLWMGPFPLHVVLGAGLYLWARELSGRWTTGLLVAGIGVFILTGSILFQSTPVVMRSNTVLFSLVPLCLYVMHRLVVESKAPLRSQIEGLVVLQLATGVLFIVMNIGRLGFFSNDVRVPLLLVAAVAIGSVLRAAGRSRQQWPGTLAFFPVIVSFMVFHIYEGAVFLTAIIVYGFALSLRDTVVQPPLAVVLALGAVLFYYAQHALIIDFPDDFSLASSLVLGNTYDAIPVRFSSRLQEIREVLPWELVTMLSLGAAGFFLRPRSAYGRAVIIVAAFLFLAYIMPDARAHRTGRAMAPFLAVLFVAGADHLGWLARQPIRWIGHDGRIVQEILQIGLTLAVFPIMLLPFLDFYTFVPVEQSHHSKVSDIEYVVADWLAENTDENVRIISDYRTMQMMSSFANKVSLTERQLYPVELTDEGRRQMAMIKNLVLKAQSGSEAWEAITGRLAGSEPAREKEFLEAAGLADKEPTYYVVWTGRTSLWTWSPEIGPVRQTTTRDPYWFEIEIFKDRRYFREVKDFDGAAYVFEVLPEPAPLPKE